jgi:hypothetical protein
MRKKAWQLSNDPRRKPPKQVEQAASDGRFFYDEQTANSKQPGVIHV